MRRSKASILPYHAYWTKLSPLLEWLVPVPDLELPAQSGFGRGCGVGAVSGGELVIASLGALESMGWPHPVLGQLGRFGFSGLVIAADVPTEVPPEPPLPVAVTQASAEGVRRLEEDLAAAIAHSRQQLYALVQQLQRLVVDQAISGHGLEDVVRATSQATDFRVFVRIGKRTLHRSPDRWLSSDDNLEILGGVEAMIGRRDHPEGVCVVYGGRGYSDEVELTASRCAWLAPSYSRGRYRYPPYRRC